MMAAKRFLYATLIVCTSFHWVVSDEGKEDEGDGEALYADTVGQSMTGMSNFFRGMADGVKDKADDGMDGLKSLSAAAQSMSEDGAETAKGWAEGFGDSFSKAKEAISETGEKMKEAIGDAATNTKEEIETAASKLQKHAMDASQIMMKMIG